MILMPRFKSFCRFTDLFVFIFIYLFIYLFIFHFFLTLKFLKFSLKFMKLKIRLFSHNHTLGSYNNVIAFILYLFQHPGLINSSGTSDFVNIPSIFVKMFLQFFVCFINFHE